MGFFSNLGNINKINVLLKQIEPKIEAIHYETQSYCPNLNRIKIECRAIDERYNRHCRQIGKFCKTRSILSFWKKNELGADIVCSY